MHRQHKVMAALNLGGGPAVLGSYVVGILGHPDTAGELWGQIPEALRPLYTANMFVAAAGYLVFTAVLWSRVDPDRARTFAGLGFAWFNACYAAILIASTLWMPLSFVALEQPAILPLVWLDLAIVAAGSLGVLVGLRRHFSRPRPTSGRLAIVGAALFCGQTVVLDFLIWPWFFRP